jgi:glycosyltransferase involved in cell wall biosynthesis
MATDDNNSPFTVSVVIPAYNAEKFIARAIDCVLSQTHQPNEIIIVDDGSTDGTAKIIQQYGQKICYIYQKNAGAASARNTGIKAAKYDWIAFLDADDQWQPEKLQLQIELLRRNPDLTWATCNYIIHTYPDNRETMAWPAQKATSLLSGKEYLNSYIVAITAGMGWNPASMIVSRQVLEQAGLFSTGMRYVEDLDMWLSIAYRHPQIGYVNQPLVVYHCGTEGSFTSEMSYQEKLQCNLSLYRRHLQLASELGCPRQLEPFIIHRLKKWIFILYCRKQFAQVRETLHDFASTLPMFYKSLMYLLTSLPFNTIEFGKKIIRFLDYAKE